MTRSPSRPERGKQPRGPPRKTVEKTLLETETVEVDQLRGAGTGALQACPLFAEDRGGEPGVGHWVAHGGSNEFVVLNKPVVRVLWERKRGQIERVDNGFF